MYFFQMVVACALASSSRKCYFCCSPTSRISCHHMVSPFLMESIISAVQAFDLSQPIYQMEQRDCDVEPLTGVICLPKQL